MASGEGRAPSRSTERRRSWLAAVPAVAPVVTFATALLGRRLLAPGDAMRVELPRKILAARMLRAGELPMLNAFAYSGSALVASGGVLYPTTLLLLVLPPVAAHNLAVVSDFVIAGVGGFLFARHLCKDDVGAVVSGVAFGLSSFFFAHITHQAMIASGAWLPWALYGVELLRERFTVRRLLLAAGSVGLAALAGHIQIVVFIVAVVGLYALALAALERHARTAGIGVAVVVVGLALGAVQLLPTVAVARSSNRAEFSYADAVTFSLPGSHLPLLAFPYLYGSGTPTGPYEQPYAGDWNHTELGCYLGLVALCLAAVGVRAGRRDRRVVALLVVGGVAFLVALGDTTPLARVVYALPVFGQFRSWARYFLAVELVVAVLAGYGVAELRREHAARRLRMATIAPALAVAGLVVVFALVLPDLDTVAPLVSTGGTRTWALVVPCLAAAAGGGVCLLFLRAPRLAAGVAIVAVALDGVLTFGLWFEWREGSPSPAEFRAATSSRVPPDWGPVTGAPGGITRYALLYHDFFVEASRPNLTDVKGLRSINGEDPLVPAAYLDATSMTILGTIDDPERYWRPGSHLLDLLRVTTVLVDPPSLGVVPGPGAVLAAPRPAGRTTLLRYEYRPALPDAWVVGAVERVSAGEAQRRVVGEVPFDPAAAAVIEEGCDACLRARQPGPAGRVVRSRFGRQSVELDMVADRHAMVLVSQSAFPGWRAHVDGEAAPLVRADAVVQGVPVGPGRHRVELRYEAPGLRAGAAVSVLTLVALLAAMVVGRRRRANGAR